MLLYVTQLWSIRNGPWQEIFFEGPLFDVIDLATTSIV